MTLNLGKKIRELRKSKNISQEVFAQYLGVSFQAVSKWETDAALPDVSLIPVIASFFGVSTDDLFDYNRLEAERKVEAICLEAYQYRANDPAKSEAILREGLKQFPGNDILLNNLLYTMKSPERSDEIIPLCKTLIQCTRDDSVKYDALRILAKTYRQTGQQALVEPTLEQIPEIYFSKLELMAHLLEGEQSLDAARRQMGLSLGDLAEMLLVMRDRLREKGQPEEASKYERIARKILEVFHQEEGEAFETGDFYRRSRTIGETLS
ncbi:MAG: helix-turn-helix transcriptional regulator [Eubacteriales bacterium]|nr:helix-turn-helix transcriptional regulator [Eubacteriales bacterium]